MENKIIVIGANHAGTSFLRTIRQFDKKSKIVTFDRNDNISFLGCGIALWVGGEFQDPQGLFYATPEELRALDIEINMQHDVIAVNTQTKTVTVKDLVTGQTREEKYDKLVYAAGTWPIMPKLPGSELKGIEISKIYQHAQRIHTLANSDEIENVVVVGAGYIGIELAEAFYMHGKKVTVIDMMDRVIPRYFDEEFTEPLEKAMVKEGVALELNQKVEKFEGKNNKVTHVVTNKGKYKADLVILSIGFIPQTSLLQGQVDTIKNGAIRVNQHCLTSQKDVYAIGDAAAIHHNVLNDNMHVALATNAVKTGIIAALSIAGQDIPFPGVQGTNAIKVFGCKYASTGFSEETCRAFGIKYKTTFATDNDKPEFMKNAEKVQVKFTYDPDTLRILGAQVGSFGETEHIEVIYMISLAIQQKLTMIDLALMDYFFLPHFNKPFNYVIYSALKAVGINY